jgi:aryl-alcohol dehydrogenase-like predicted oxidoreductase
MMVGFNLLNQSARSRVFKKTLRKNIGVLGMFAVRRALSQPTHLRALLAELAQKGQIDPAAYETEDPLGFLTQGGKAATIPEAAYRYCRYEPGLHVVLSGTGNVEHLKENVISLLKPPLAETDAQRLATVFGRVDSVSGN